MININLLDELNRLGFGADIDALETYVAQLQDASTLGAPLVASRVYAEHIKLLRELRPESYALTRNCEQEDNALNEYDTILAKYGMKIMPTIQTMNDLDEFKLAIGDKTYEMVAYSELNGHAIRAVYVNGILESGSTRGKYRKGRDITRHVKAVLPNYIAAWQDIRVVEVRGNMLISSSDFEKVRHLFKTPLSAVTSFIREDVTDNELELLNCICYKCMPDNPEKLKFENLWDEMSHLEENGFKIPPRLKIPDVDYYNLGEVVDEALEHFGVLLDKGELKYTTNGVVMAINNNADFYDLGINDDHFIGNFVLKMGPHWESNVYSSTILEIVWEPGKQYLEPKAIIEPVVTVTGSEVSSVPLYNVGVMERYGYTPGNSIYFKFGGETGVTTVQPDGTPVNTLDN